MTSSARAELKAPSHVACDFLGVMVLFRFARRCIIGACVSLHNHPPLLPARSWLRWVIFERMAIHCGTSNQLRQVVRRIEHVAGFENGRNLVTLLKPTYILAFRTIQNHDNDPFDWREFSGPE